jgi:DNA polymerase-3 subunit alpha (Gram-positive type)
MAMLQRLRIMQIDNVKQINTMLQNSNLLSKQFNQYIDIYAKKQTSIKTIYKIISTSLTKHLYGNPRIFKKELLNARENLLIVNAPVEGDV